MMKLKKILAGLTCLALLAAPGAAFADSNNVSLVVNKSLVNSDEAAGQVYINDAGYTMIPLRVVNDAFGYKTDWQKRLYRQRHCPYL
ncbi:MAG: stalk domain-containing protein [Clostridia bacterium]|nr:stalk domain-containing protein [Clostridia bacterium]